MLHKHGNNCEESSLFLNSLIQYAKVLQDIVHTLRESELLFNDRTIKTSKNTQSNLFCRKAASVFMKTKRLSA